LSFGENLAKEKKLKGIAYLGASSIFWIIFLVSWLLSALGIQMRSLTEAELILLFRYFFPFIGLALTIKGIIILAKLNILERILISMTVKKFFIIFALTGIGIVIMGLVLSFLSPDSQPVSQEITKDYREGIGFVGAFGLIFGVPIFVYGLKNMKKKKLMESFPTSTSKISSLEIGTREIKGKVVPCKSEIMKSPFSNRDCVGVKIIIEVFQTGEGSAWHKVKTLVRGIEFFLQDDTGMVLVDLRGAELDIPSSYEFESGSGEDPPSNFVNFLRKYNVNLERYGYRTLSQRAKFFFTWVYEESLGRNKPRRYLESIIKPGDELYVLGRADVNPNFREGDAEHGVQDLMMQQSHNPKIYFISTRSKKQILEKLKYKALIFSGLLILGGSLFLIALNVELILSPIP